MCALTFARRFRYNISELTIHKLCIEHVQQQKIRPVMRGSDLTRSVDSFNLAKEIDLWAQEAKLTQAVLLEVNIEGYAEG